MPPIKSPNPQTILGSTLDFWVRSDRRVAVAGGKVKCWGDLSGNGNDLAFLPNDARPDVDSPSWDPLGGPNGRPAVVFDGIDDSLLNNTLVYALPFYYWAIIEHVSWADGHIFWISMQEAFAVGNVSQLGLGIGSPNVVQANGELNYFNVNSNSSGALGSFFRLEAAFTNSTNDFLNIHSTVSTGKNSGSDQGGTPGLRLGANQDPGAWSNIAVVELLKCSAVPTLEQRAALDAYGVARYEASIL
jgi:hypothetical protein